MRIVIHHSSEKISGETQIQILWEQNLHSKTINNYLYNW